MHKVSLGSIPKSVVSDVSNDQIGDCENTLSFPSVEPSLGSGLPSHLPREMYHARPALLTVFSTTQSDYSITLLSIQAITDIRMR